MSGHLKHIRWLKELGKLDRNGLFCATFDVERSLLDRINCLACLRKEGDRKDFNPHSLWVVSLCCLPEDIGF